MEQEYAHHTIAVDAPKTVGLALGKFYKAQYQRKEQQQHSCRSDKSLFLSHSTEYEVCVLLGHKLQLGLCAIKETLSTKSALANGNLALMNVIACSCQVLVKTEQHIDTGALVGFHDIVQHMVGRIEEHYGAYGEGKNIEIAR